MTEVATGPGATDPDAGGRVRTPWRDNLEAMTMAVVMAVLLKGFLVEAYKIPTGSMQPTLIGEDAMDVHDRILVDKLSFTFRDPKRFEVVVFRFPLDRSKAFVKRLVGVGPEELRIHHGDLWRRDDAAQDWEILRRPRAVQGTAWKDVEPFSVDRPAWTVESEGAAWEIGLEGIVADGSGVARWRPELGTVRDRYWHGYDRSLLSLLERRRERGGLHGVGDLRLEATVEAGPGTEAVVLELEENDLRARFHLPGPAAAPEARVRIELVGARGRLDPVPPGVALESDWRLPADQPVRVAAQALDDLLELQLGDDWVLAAPVPSVSTGRAGARLEVQGGRTELTELRLLRDIYYTASGTGNGRWTIPDGHYFALGDNTQDSSDSREWSYERYRVPRELVPGSQALAASAPVENDLVLPGDGAAAETADPDALTVLRANARRGENPRTYGYGLPGGPRMRLIDEWGEPHDLPVSAARKLSPEASPFIPRELILGRALAIFWPLDPRRGVYRRGWIR